MAIDPYMRCPCGGGKKVKFCCCKDILSDLEKVLRSVEAEQRAAALDQVNKLISAQGARSALLVLKANLQISMGGTESAAETVAELFKGAPHNPVALALKAAIEAADGEIETAVEKLQQAIEYLDDFVPHTIVSVIGLVAHGLLASGRVMAALGHLSMQAALLGNQRKSVVEVLLRIQASPDVPLLLKEERQPVECPPDVAWRGEYNAAMKSARQGAWLAACESLMSLADKVPGQPSICCNMAILRGWLGQSSRAAAAWRQYASLESVPLEDAVEAEALARYLDTDRKEATVDQITLTYRVQDMDRLLECLLSDQRVTRVPLDVRELATDDGPPPRGVFLLLHPPLTEGEPDLQLDAVPQVQGEIYLYGKETDRDARLEFVVERLADFEDRKSLLANVVGELAAELQKEEVSGTVAEATALLNVRWRFPDGTPRERQGALMREQFRESMLRRWPELPLASLNGKCPREAAAEPGRHVALLAEILILELANGLRNDHFEFDELRTQLGLPVRGPIDPTGTAVDKLPAVRLVHLDLKKLSDSDLLHVFQRATLKSHRRAVYRCAAEILERDGLRSQLDVNNVYDALVATATDTDAALQHLEQARRYSESRGGSPVHWLLTELSLRFARREIDEVNRLLRVIKERHLREPGVAQALRELLVSYGVATPDGRPTSAAQPAAAETEAAPEEPQRIWTPDAPEPGPAPQGRSKLWIPGRD